MITILDRKNSIVNNWIHAIRDEKLQSDKARFRAYLEQLGAVLGYELSKELTYERKSSTTLLGEYEGQVLAQSPIVGTVLRAGLPMFQGVMSIFEASEAAFLCTYRHYHKSGKFEISRAYASVPDVTDRDFILVDTMLATGASLVCALKDVYAKGIPKSVHIICAIASTEGVSHLQKHYPEINFWIGSLDDELTAKGYIVPGLGDAGDLAYGTKL